MRIPQASRVSRPMAGPARVSHIFYLPFRVVFTCYYRDIGADMQEINLFISGGGTACFTAVILYRFNR